jgi:type IV pilus assembly protein PilF
MAEQPARRAVSDRKTRERAAIQTELGVGYIRENKNDVALRRLRQALEMAPDYAPAHNAIALLYGRLGQLNAAEKHYKLAIDYDPAFSAARTNYGSFLCQRNRIEEAEKSFIAAVRNPLYDRPDLALANAGYCMYRAGQMEKAEKYFRAALERNPRLPNALISMSDISMKKGNALSARAYLQRYVEVASHSPRSLALGIDIEKEMGDKNALASYTMLLRSKYPDSKEARELAKQRSQ